MIAFVQDDGGREAAGFKGEAGDCAVRAIAIASGDEYRAVYDDLASWMREHPREARGKTTPRDGVPMRVARSYMEHKGWAWTPTMHIGQGCTVHLRADELPSGRLVVRLSGHFAAVIDGVLHDNHDCSRDGTRCVYGFWSDDDPTFRFEDIELRPES